MLSTAQNRQQWVAGPASRTGIATCEGTGYDSPAMGDERRWAARYQYLDALWRGRDRIICDRELEAALHAGVEGSLGELLAGLFPGEAARGQASGRAWMALHNDRRAVSFARERSGTVFVSLDEAAEIASDEPWQVALVHLEGDHGDHESFLEVLGERLEDDPQRSVVLSLDCTDDEDACYERLAELIERLFGDGRIYGLTRPSMAAFYDFGPVLEPAGDGLEPEGAPAEAAEADIEVDNSLGSEAPRFELFLAVVGASLPSEGVTFVELPAAEHRAAEPGRSPNSPNGGGDDELAALRSSLGAQLAEAQRRGDLHAIERQSLLEKLEQAEDRIASLEDQLGERDQLGEGHKPAETPAGPRLDELLAREQTQRWELARLRGEIERLEARPVEELEAEVASLRAELEQARRDLELASEELEGQDEDEFDEDDEDELDDETLARLADMLGNGDQDGSTPAQAREWRRARSKLDHLLRKLERGGRLSALELHRELVALKRSLLSLGGV
jgi:hypothetical protein